MSNICPVCQKESAKIKCEMCEFEIPSFAFLSEEDANKWYKDIVLPEREKWENREKSSCVKCGREMQEGWKVCPYCETSVKPAIKKTTVKTALEVQSTVTGKKNWVIKIKSSRVCIILLTIFGTIIYGALNGILWRIYSPSLFKYLNNEWQYQLSLVIFIFHFFIGVLPTAIWCVVFENSKSIVLILSSYIIIVSVGLSVVIVPHLKSDPYYFYYGDNSINDVSKMYYRFYNQFQGYNSDPVIVDLNKSLQLNPNNTWAYFFRGLTYLNKGEYNQAVDDLNKVILLDPKQVRVYYYLGLAYQKMGDYGHAIEKYKAMLQVDPYHGAAKRNLKHAQQALGR